VYRFFSIIAVVYMFFIVVVHVYMFCIVMVVSVRVLYCNSGKFIRFVL